MIDGIERHVERIGEIARQIGKQDLSRLAPLQMARALITLEEARAELQALATALVQGSIPMNGGPLFDRH